MARLCRCYFNFIISINIFAGYLSASEFFLSKMLSKKDDALESLNLQISQLSELLSFRKKENKDLNNTISVLNEKNKFHKFYFRFNDYGI